MNEKSVISTWIIPSMFLFMMYLACGEPDQPISLQPVTEFLGNEESCIKCHGKVEGFSPYHQPSTFGCAACHLGHPKEADKIAAHEGMVRIPGNLSNVKATCGNASCHPKFSEDIFHSLMTTMSGVVSVNRYVFGATDSIEAHAHVKDLNVREPADAHLRQLCASCHLGNDKTGFGPVTERSRGGGCNACHLNYSNESKNELETYLNQLNSDSLLRFHPRLSLEVSNEHCFGCHSRSGRISTNYEGWHETTLEEMPTDSFKYRLLADGRIFEKQADDVHHKRGLDCIDCHTATELMGNGTRYQHKAEALEIQCADCHFSKSAQTISYADLNIEEKKIIALRNLGGDASNFLKVEKTGKAILNSSLDQSGQPVLIKKNTRDTLILKPPADVCTKDAAHNRLTCDACHTGWAPQCLGCHTEYTTLEKGYDLMTHQQMQGKWIEHLGSFFAEPPPLGIVTEELSNGQQIEHIKTFLVGMIATIDQSAFPGHESDTIQFRRLFSPTSAHTTQVKGRTCNSCHASPVALGYGRGKLTYQIKNNIGKWVFESEYENSTYDGLPEDAWIGFLVERKGMVSTRSNARPFTIEEQKRILTVGACLSCHAEESKVMLESLEDFQKVISNRTTDCVLPSY
jgi:hypothetical protein